MNKLEDLRALLTLCLLSITPEDLKRYIGMWKTFVWGHVFPNMGKHVRREDTAEMMPPQKSETRRCK